MYKGDHHYHCYSSEHTKATENCNIGHHKVELSHIFWKPGYDATKRIAIKEKDTSPDYLLNHLFVHIGHAYLQKDIDNERSSKSQNNIQSNKVPKDLWINHSLLFFELLYWPGWYPVGRVELHKCWAKAERKVSHDAPASNRKLKKVQDVSHRDLSTIGALFFNEVVALLFISVFLLLLSNYL